jgi:exodeoxyribonuclease-3
MTGAWQPSLIPAAVPAHVAATSVVRVLIFNAQHASPARAWRQVEWIASQETADLVVLTEVGHGPGGAALVSALAAHGYSSVLAHERAPRDYRVILASRGPELTEMPSGIDALPHRGPAASFILGGHAIGLLGLYVPSRGPQERRNEDKRAFQQSVSRALPGLVARFPGLVIVAGDLNVVEPGHEPHHSVFGDWEYDFYNSLAAAGLTDVYRRLHPSAADHSWFGRSGLGYRFDHAFVSTPHRAQVHACDYLHEPRRQGLSDHAAMTLSVALE